VYPIARGLAPLLIAFWAWALLGEKPPVGGLFGLLLVMAGLLVVLGAGWAKGAGIGHALAVALSISIYSTIDGAAVRRSPPLAYAVLIFATPAILMLPVLLRRHGRAELLDVGRSRLKPILLIGVLMGGAYALALQAYSMAPLAYVGALREISVVFAAIAGWRMLGEPFGAWRSLGAILIFLGAAAIALLG
jgi:drug/metabolite transporter (DMT)-like permease